MSLLTLCVCFVIFSYVDRTAGLKECHDCMPYKHCNEANWLAITNKSKNTIRLFKKAHCGFHNRIAKICCSEFQPQHVPFQEKPVHPNLHLLPESCGKIISDYIVGGDDAGIYEFPWMVVIIYDNFKFGCAGTLINSRYVLTAAHCAVNKDIYRVRIGDFNLAYDMDCQGNICENYTQDREVELKIVHDYYNWNTYTNDIALLRLKHPVELQLRNADTICLPTTEELRSQSITAKQATAVGWGLAERGEPATVLQKVDIPILSPQICQDYYGHVTGPEPTQFCAGVEKKDTCKGDSGGPLMLDSMIRGQSKVVQYGIVSNGRQQCGTEYPGIYTDVRKYVNWILDTIKE